jgi:hypothetical protein
MPKYKPMDIAFLILTVLGLGCSLGAGVVKWVNDQQTATAKANAAKAEKEESARSAKEEREKADRLAEVRLGEMRMLFAARMEAESLRQQVLAQPTLTQSQTEKLAEVQKSIEGLDDVISKALSEVSAETAAAIKSQAEEEAKLQADKSITAKEDERLLPATNRILEVIIETIRGSAKHGLVQILEEKYPNQITQAIVWPENPGLERLLYEVRCVGDFRWIISYYPGVLRRGDDGNLTGWGPTFNIFCVAEKIDRQRILQVSIIDIHAPRGLSMSSGWNSPFPTSTSSTSDRMIQLQDKYSAGALSDDAFVAELVMEAIKLTVVWVAIDSRK